MFSNKSLGSCPKAEPAYPGTLDYHLQLRKAERAYAKTFDHPGYEAWLRKGCPLNNPNPPDIWLAEVALTVDKLPDHLLDLDRMQVILARIKD
jgi:hypothetical protein